MKPYKKEEFEEAQKKLIQKQEEVLEKSKRSKTLDEIENEIKSEQCYKSKTRYLAVLIFIALIVVVLFFLGLILVIVGNKTNTSLEVLIFLFTVIGAIGLYFLYKKVYKKIAETVEEKMNHIRTEKKVTKTKKEALDEAKKLILQDMKKEIYEKY